MASCRSAFGRRRARIPRSHRAHQRSHRVLPCCRLHEISRAVRMKYLMTTKALMRVAVFVVALGAERSADALPLSIAVGAVSSDRVTLRVSGAAGAGYFIDTTTDFESWTTVSTNRPADTEAALPPIGPGVKFYRARSRGAIQTVFVMMMENTDWSTFEGNANAPYINSLLPKFSRAKNYRSFGHPSLPNYTYLEAGDNLGLVNGSWLPGPDHSQTTTNHLTSMLFGNGVSWKYYAENMPGGGSVVPLVDGNGYSLDHNPFVYFYDVTGNP